MAARIGNIGPLSKEFMEGKDMPSDPNLRPENLLPPDVVIVHSGFNLSDYTPEGVEEGAARYFDRVAEVAAQKVDRIGWQGLPISAQLGRERSLQMIAETAKRTGVPAGSDAEDVIDGFKHLGVRKGDAVAIFTPNLSEAVIAVLACFRIGALFNTVFSGFSARSLRDRLQFALIANDAVMVADLPELAAESQPTICLHATAVFVRSCSLESSHHIQH